MKYYDITVRVSAEAVRLAQAGPEDPPLHFTEYITEDHLKAVGELMAEELQNVADSYEPTTAAYRASAGPFRERGGEVSGRGGNLAALADLTRKIQELQAENRGLEAEKDQLLEAILRDAPRCWDGVQGMEIPAILYVRKLETAARVLIPADSHATHEEWCDGECTA
jgi:hypothetical protein